eukprot:TRINITY_DN2327_c0_g1_i4.p1 TRINITY_DN2327_c0_g1~~TRINITY_DN2327_c0_g1_i4.p1  ORF type:complete len:271 (-),score=59.16 TRINITY_DN2327_c0_g1_i4:21-833(-)
MPNQVNISYSLPMNTTDNTTIQIDYRKCDETYVMLTTLTYPLPTSYMATNLKSGNTYTFRFRLYEESESITLENELYEYQTKMDDIPCANDCVNGQCSPETGNCICSNGYYGDDCSNEGGLCTDCYGYECNNQWYCSPSGDCQVYGCVNGVPTKNPENCHTVTCPETPCYHKECTSSGGTAFFSCIKPDYLSPDGYVNHGATTTEPTYSEEEMQEVDTSDYPESSEVEHEADDQDQTNSGSSKGSGNDEDETSRGLLVSASLAVAILFFV